MTANRYSFQANANMISAAAAIAGIASGSATRTKAPKWLAPSTSAASSSSIGRSKKVWRQITTTNGRMKVGVHQDQRQAGVQQVERREHDEERHRGRDRRQHALREEPDGQVLVRDREKAEARERVSGRQAQRERDRHGRERDYGAVQKRAVELRHRNCWLQFSKVGVKLTNGMPSPVTVKVSAGRRRLFEIAQ